jgi:site-specific recombinase XerD
LFADWADEFLEKITHPNTKKRYKSSVEKLKTTFRKMRLNEIAVQSIDDYKQRRLDDGVEPATINHDLRVTRRLMRIAERKRLIPRTPFVAKSDQRAAIRMRAEARAEAAKQNDPKTALTGSFQSVAVQRLKVEKPQ